MQVPSPATVAQAKSAAIKAFKQHAGVSRLISHLTGPLQHAWKGLARVKHSEQQVKQQLLHEAERDTCNADKVNVYDAACGQPPHGLGAGLVTSIQHELRETRQTMQELEQGQQQVDQELQQLNLKLQLIHPQQELMDQQLQLIDQPMQQIRRELNELQTQRCRSLVARCTQRMLLLMRKPAAHGGPKRRSQKVVELIQDRVMKRKVNEFINVAGLRGFTAQQFAAALDDSCEFPQRYASTDKALGRDVTSFVASGATTRLKKAMPAECALLENFLDLQKLLQTAKAKA